MAIAVVMGMRLGFEEHLALKGLCFCKPEVEVQGGILIAGCSKALFTPVVTKHLGRIIVGFYGELRKPAYLFTKATKELSLTDVAALYVSKMVSQGSSLIRAIYSLIYKCSNPSSIAIASTGREVIVASGVQAQSNLCFTEYGCMIAGLINVELLESYIKAHCRSLKGVILAASIHDMVPRVRLLKPHEAYRL